jgi:hypothetical protein
MELIPPTAKKRSLLQLSNFSMFVLYCIVGQREGFSIQSAIVSAPSSELDPPFPSPQASVCPPPHLDPGEGTHLLAVEGVGRAHSDDQPGDSVL